MYSSPLCGDSAVYRNSLFEKGYSETRERWRGEREREKERESTTAEMEIIDYIKGGA